MNYAVDISTHGRAGTLTYLGAEDTIGTVERVSAASLESDLLQVYTIRGLFLDGYAEIIYIMRGRI